MDHKKTSLVMAVIPAITAIGLMAKMNIDHDSGMQQKKAEITALQAKLSDQENKFDAVSRLCEEDVDCPSLIINRFEDMKNRISSLSDLIKDKEEEISHLSEKNNEKQDVIHSLESRMRELNDTLRITRQTVDAQISVELETVEEKIDEIRSDYEKVIASLQGELRKARKSAQQEVIEKENKFRDLHKKSINNLLGMVDSLAQERESRIIPLISIYSDEEVKNDFICADESDLSPTEMIFAKHMDKHWLTWPVTVQTNSQNELRAQTDNGYSLHVKWENGDNMYELSPGDDITIQFQPEKDQSCSSAIQGKRAVFTTH